MEAIKSNLKGLLEQTGEFLYCPNCGGEYSACRGDYFMLSDDYVFTCCGEPMIVAREQGGRIEAGGKADGQQLLC